MIESKSQSLCLIILSTTIEIVFNNNEYLSKFKSKSNNRIFSLNKNIEKRIVVMILTKHTFDLSNSIDFEIIKSNSFSIKRDNDVNTIDFFNVIRVFLKIAMQFITKLQQRKETTFSNSKSIDINNFNESKKCIR